MRQKLELSLAFTAMAFLVLGLNVHAAAEAKSEKPPAEHLAAAEGGGSTPANRVGEYPEPLSIAAEDWVGLVPDASLTPGAIDACLHAKDICGGTTKSRRHTTEDEKKQALQNYLNMFSNYEGLLNVDKVHSKPKEPDHEIDHLISLELAGADVPQNLWPQPYQSTIAGAHDKDEVEDHTKEEMCAILKTQGEAAADSYLAMMQRMIAGGLSHDGGKITPPAASWYDLYHADVLENTNHHGVLKSGAKISFAATLEKFKADILTLPQPQSFPDDGCTPPQIAQ